MDCVLLLLAFFDPRVLRAHGGSGYTFGALAIVRDLRRVDAARDLHRCLNAPSGRFEAGAPKAH